MLKKLNDLSLVLDKGNSALLVLLDLSAAFDTIQHTKLIKRLHTTYGIEGCALKWFSSYLSDRSQVVGIAGNVSRPASLQYGVPQGSVLGPVLFTLYTAPVNIIIERHHLSYHKYADDVQLYVEYCPSSPASVELAVQRIQDCVAEISEWMAKNGLKLNGDKTELLNITTPHNLKKYGTLSITLDGTTIVPSTAVKNLGVHFDQHLTMSRQITAVVQSCNYHIRNIGKIRQFISEDVCKNAVQALVISRLDYCSSLYASLPQYEIDRLQRLQNRAARLITRTSISQHITPILHNLHWLPVDCRIVFRILVLVYRCFNKSSPTYLQELLQIYCPTRTLRSSSDGSLLVIPRNQRNIGKQAFSVSGPTLWNSIRIELRHAQSLSAFKRGLKTSLFRQHFTG